MRVYFTASQRGKKEFNHEYNTIYKVLEDLHLDHVDDDLVKYSIDDFYKRFKASGAKKTNDMYRQNIEKLKKADIIVFECSFHSLSIGFMIDKALELNKPTIALYQKEYLPHFLEGIENEKFVLKQYSKENLKEKIKEAIEEALHLRDKRFNFFISPNLLTYLEEESKKQDITKSAFIRTLILAHRRKSK